MPVLGPLMEQLRNEVLFAIGETICKGLGLKCHGTKGLYEVEDKLGQYGLLPGFVRVGTRQGQGLEQGRWKWVGVFT